MSDKEQEKMIINDPYPHPDMVNNEMSLNEIINTTVDEFLQPEEENEDQNEGQEDAFADFKLELVKRVKAYYASLPEPKDDDQKPKAKRSSSKAKKSSKTKKSTDDDDDDDGSKVAKEPKDWPKFTHIVPMVAKGNAKANGVMVTPAFNFKDTSTDGCTVYEAARDSGKIDVEGEEMSFSELVKRVSTLFTGSTIKRTASVWGLLSAKDRKVVIDALY